MGRMRLPTIGADLRIQAAIEGQPLLLENKVRIVNYHCADAETGAPGVRQQPPKSTNEQQQHANFQGLHTLRTGSEIQTRQLQRHGLLRRTIPIKSKAFYL